MRVEKQKSGTVSLRHFYLRRALRILPPFYLLLALAAGLTVLQVLPGTLTFSTLFAQSLHYSNYWFVTPGNAGSPAGTVVYWSLAVEEHFYVLFPLFYLALSQVASNRAQGRVLWIICALICVWRCILVFGYNVAEDRTYMASDTRFDSILFGCALALAMNPVLAERSGSERLWEYVLLPAGLALLLGTFVYRAPW